MPMGQHVTSHRWRMADTGSCTQVPWGRPSDIPGSLRRSLCSGTSKVHIVLSRHSTWRGSAGGRRRVRLPRREGPLLQVHEVAAQRVRVRLHLARRQPAKSHVSAKS